MQTCVGSSFLRRFVNRFLKGYIRLDIDNFKFINSECNILTYFILKPYEFNPEDKEAHYKRLEVSTDSPPKNIYKQDSPVFKRKKRKCVVM